MREYTILRPGRPGIVADDETILLEIQRIGAGTFTLVVDDYDDDDDDDDRPGSRVPAHARPARVPTP